MYRYRYMYANCVPGSLYAICGVHQDGDGFNEWRTRSHACLCVFSISCCTRSCF